MAHVLDYLLQFLRLLIFKLVHRCTYNYVICPYLFSRAIKYVNDANI